MNSSTALARVLAAALPQLGVRHIVLCPGSRSAALAYALAAMQEAGQLTLHVRIDERSAAFLALGLSRADPAGRPAAIVTTSGTAAANLHPAVLEASHAGVPLLVLTADRPHELRGTGANQTTDQVRLFGTSARFFAEIPAGSWPSPDSGKQPGVAGGWRNLLARAVAATTGALDGDPGPVHLNVAFDEPLTPDDATEPVSSWAPVVSERRGLTEVAPFTRVTSSTRWPDMGSRVTRPAGEGSAEPRTVVLAGDGAGPAAAEVAAAGGFPLLSEPSSGARAEAIPAYRMLLGCSGFGDAVERVLVFGRPTLSRPVTRLLARDDVQVIVVSARPVWTDAARRAALVVPALEPEDVVPSMDSQWLARWQAAGQAAAGAIGAVLDREARVGRLNGPLVAREVAAATDENDILVAGSSNPIRDLDLVMDGFDGFTDNFSGQVLANRGLAGIDGVISTAAGVALAGIARQVRVLVGDLTFLHDAGGLASGLLEPMPDVQIVVMDDAGGGIFETLEQGELAGRSAAGRAVFERVFGTPQDVDLAALCAGYGVRYGLVKDVDGLRQTLAMPGRGLSVVHARIDRTSRRDLGDRLAAKVTEAVAKLS